MYLRLAKSQRRDFLFRLVYVLTARIDASRDDFATIAQHRITHERVFTSPQALELAQRAIAAHKRARKISPWRGTHAEIAALHWENLKTLTLAVRARLAFSINIGDLIAGATIQTRDLHQLIQAEAAILEAFDALKALVEHARTFDENRETLHIPDADTSAPVPPAIWRPFSNR